ncbi:hypothetical protein Tco_1114810, partial [Tanacetum coccineum]
MNKVTDIPDSLLISFYISGLKLNLQHEFLVSRPTTLGDAFSLARITEAHFEAIAEKGQNIKEKADTTLSLPIEEVSPVVKGPLDASEDTLLSLQSEDPNFKIQEKAVEYVRALNVAPFEVVFAGHVDEVRDKFFEFSEDKGCVKKISAEYFGRLYRLTIQIKVFELYCSDVALCLSVFESMSTPVFVDPESSTLAYGAQSSRVPVPLPEDPYEPIRQAYLDFKDPIDTETLELPLTIAPPTSLSESTPPVLVPIFRRTTRMAVRAPPAMSSYESSPSVSPPDLLLRKRYRGTSELVEDSEEDEEIEESMDSDSVSKDAKDEGPTIEDEDPAVEDEGLTAGVEGPGMHDERYGLDDESHGMDDESRDVEDKGHSVEYDGLGLEEEEEAVHEGQQQAALVMGTALTLTTWTDPEDSMVYIDVPTYPPPAPPVQTSPSPEWTSGSLRISSSHSDVPSPISSPIIPLTVPSPVATPDAVETEGFLTELGAQVEMQGGLIRDHAVRLEELSPALFERYDRDIGELFTRSRAVRNEIFSQRYRFKSQTDAQRAAMWHAISDVKGENQDLQLQLAEERRARLELAEVVD